MMIECGHSICGLCSPQFSCCPSCGIKILKNSKINYSLMELAQRDHTNVDKFIKICLIGSSGVGKTSLIRMLTNQEYSEDVASTIGFDFTFLEKTIKNYTIRYQFWDSAGQERYQSISPIHYKSIHLSNLDANIILLVYNVNETEENNKIKYWIDEAEKYCPKGAKIILVGNKIDLLEGKLSKPFDL